MTKQIHVNVGYSTLSDKDVATQGVAVVDGMTNNPKFVNPPINPADLKTQVETYASLIAAAADGSKKAITERKKQRAVGSRCCVSWAIGWRRTVMTIQRPSNPAVTSRKPRPSAIRRLSRSTVRHRSRWRTVRTVARQSCAASRFPRL